MRVGRIRLSLAILIFQAAAAFAQSCVFTNTGINFGNVNLSGGGTQSSTGTFSAVCTGTPNQTIRICANFNAGSGGASASGDPRYLTQGATRLNYNLYRNNGGNQVWGSHTWSGSSQPPNISLAVGATGTVGTSLPIYGKIASGQGALPTGTYLSLFSGNHTQIDYGYAPAFRCGATLSPRVQNVPFLVRVTNNSSCTVSTTALDFGDQANLSIVKTANNTVSVTCTGGTLYTVGMNNGTSGATNPAARRMTNTGTPQSVTYGIYRDAGFGQVWGNTPGTDTAAGAGTGSAQNFTGFGRIPVQTTPPALTYTDTVVVTVTY